MKSRTIPPFWKLYYRLPAHIQRKADKAYQLWQVNPFAKGLYFKRVDPNEPIYSVRIGLGHRAFGLLDGDTVFWYWIGDHDEYDRLLN